MLIPNDKKELQLTPFDYQRNAAKLTFARANKSQGTGIFGEVGTGKSLIGLMAGVSIANEKILWITTSFLKSDIIQKIKEYFKYEIPVAMLGGKKKDFPKRITEFPFEVKGADLETAKIVIVNYDLLRQSYKRDPEKDTKYPYYEAVKKFIKYDVVIADESHRIKSPDSSTTKAVHNLIDVDGVVGIPMTGTPIPNGLENLWSQLRMCKIPNWPEKYWDFKTRYCQMGGFKNKVIVGYDTIYKEELKGIIKDSTISILKKDVLTILEKIVDNVYTELSDDILQKYKKYKKDQVLEFEELGLEINTNNKLILNQRLQAFASGFAVESHYKEKDNGEKEKYSVFKLVHKEKLVFAIEYLKNMIEREPEVKIILWYHFNASGDELEKMLKKEKIDVSRISGSTKNKHEEIEAFKSSKKNILLVNIAIMEGYTVTEAQYSVYYENDFSQLKKEQSGGRNHRPGQTKQVYEINLCVLETVDEKIVKRLTEKKENSDKFLSFVKIQKKNIDEIFEAEFGKGKKNKKRRTES